MQFWNFSSFPYSVLFLRLWNFSIVPYSLPVLTLSVRPQHGKQVKVRRQDRWPWTASFQPGGKGNKSRLGDKLDSLRTVPTSSKTKACNLDSLGQAPSELSTPLLSMHFHFDKICTFLLVVCSVLEFFLTT